jgi:hypothetical protein
LMQSIDGNRAGLRQKLPAPARPVLPCPGSNSAKSPPRG